MTLAKLKLNDWPIWLVGALLVIIPIQYYADPSFGQSAIRLSQQQFYQVMATALFALFVLRNVYLGLLLLWSTFSYAYFGFPNPVGSIVLSVLGACLIYEAVYRVVTAENIKVVFGFMVWFAVANAVYMLMQRFGWELIFHHHQNGLFNTEMVGFMGLKAILGMFFAMAMPFIAVRYPFFALGVFIPIYFTECSAAMGAAIVAYLWQMWHISKKWFYIMLAVLLIGGIIYAKHDSQAGMFTDRMNLWRVALRDAVKRPIMGYGLDSFRCITPDKQWMYWKNVRTKESCRIDVKDTIEYQHTGKYDLKKYGSDFKQGDTLDPWDNPHNEYIQLFYEWGIIPFIFLIAMIFDMKRRFQAQPYSCRYFTIPLVGFFLSVLVMSVGQFPFHLARVGFYIPVFLACFYKLTETEWKS